MEAAGEDAAELRREANRYAAAAEFARGQLRSADADKEASDAAIEDLQRKVANEHGKVRRLKTERDAQAKSHQSCAVIFT